MLLDSLADEPVAWALATQANDNWNAAKALGEELTAVLLPATAPETIELMERFDGETFAQPAARSMLLSSS